MSGTRTWRSLRWFNIAGTNGLEVAGERPSPARSTPDFNRQPAPVSALFAYGAGTSLTHKTKYRVGNWPAYDRALVQRGDVTLWLTPEAIATWEAVGVGKRGGQLQYSEVAIETALTLRLIFHLPLRQTEGFLRSIFGMLCLALSAPDHTTLSRRGQHLDLALRRLPAGAGIHLIVDSTGLSTVGEGEWAAVKHGGRGIRGWKKLHLGVDGSGGRESEGCIRARTSGNGLAPGPGRAKAARVGVSVRRDP